MPAKDVKAYVKRNKNDAADAEAICEAVRRPTMRFVQIKSVEQQGRLMLHRARERRIAEEQRRRAEATLAAATKTANGLVVDLAQRFRDVLGIPASLIKDILDRARALQEQLIKSGQATPELRRSEVEALFETATSLLAIGDTAGALAAAEQARQIMADLAASNPTNAGWQRDLSVSYNKVGDVQVAQGDLARRAQVLPRQPRHQRAAGAIRSRQRRLAARSVGVARQSWRRAGGAGRPCRRAQGLPREPRHQGAAGAIRSRQRRLAERRCSQLCQACRVYRQSNDREKSLAALRQGKAIMDRLVKLSPDNARWKRDLAWFDEQIAALTE